MQLYGWDTCYLASIDQVNAALTSHAASLIGTLNFVIALPGGENASVEMTLSPWQVVPGGAGQLLFLSLPVESGKLSAPGGVIDLSGSVLVVQVSLQLLAPTAGQAALIFDLSVAGTVGGAGGPGVVEPISMTCPQTLDSAAQTGILNQTAVTLVNEASQLTFALASVNLVAPGSGTWLTPVLARYAYEPVVAGAVYLAVFGSVTERDVSQLPLSIDPEMVTAREPGVFAMSQDLFLVNVIAPLLPGPLGGSAASYSYDTTTHTIGLSQQVSMSGITVGLITYEPQLQSLAISTDNQGLTITVGGSCDLKAGISMTFSVSARNPLTFDPGSGSIGFAKDPSPVSSHDADIPWYWQWLSPIVGLITDAVVAVIADDLAADITGAVSGDNLAATPALAVSWTGSSGFTALSAAIDSGYYVAGRL